MTKGNFRLRVSIDQSVCVGAGLCVLSASDVFDQRDEDGVVKLLQVYPGGGAVRQSAGCIAQVSVEGDHGRGGARGRAVRRPVSASEPRARALRRAREIDAMRRQCALRQYALRQSALRQSALRKSAQTSSAIARVRDASRNNSGCCAINVAALDRAASRQGPSSGGTRSLCQASERETAGASALSGR